MHVVKLDTRLIDMQLDRILTVTYFRYTLKQAEYQVHICKSILQAAIHDTQEVERYKQLQHQGIDEHNVTDANRTCRHVSCCEHQNQRDTNGDDG